VLLKRFVFWQSVLLALLVSSCSINSEDREYRRAFDKAKSLFGTGRKAESIRFIDSFFASRKNVDEDWLFDKYHLKKNYHYYNSQYDSSNLYVDSMVYILEKNPDQDDYLTKYTLGMNDMGDIFYARNDFGKAFEYYYKSRLAAVANADTCNMGNHSYHLGMVSYRQEKYEDAIGYFRQSFVENERCGRDSINFFRSQELLNNIGLSYTRLLRHDSALHYYEAAIRYMDANGHRYGDYSRQFIERAKGVIYGNLAKVYTYRGAYDTAEQLLQRSITINRRAGYDSIDVQYAHMQLAELYFQQGKSPEALLSEIRVLLDKIPNNDVLLRWYLLMSQYEDKKGSPGKALSFLHRYIRLKDSLESASTIRQTNIGQLLEYQEARSRMQLLTRDNELRKLYLLVGAVFFIMLLAIAGLIYHNYCKSKANVAKLTALNQKIRERNEDLSLAMSALEQSIREKNRIVKVVAHDLRGPVSGVAFLADRMLKLSELEDEDRKSLTIIRDTCQSNMKLISELLEKRHGEEQKDAEQIDPAPVLNRTISLLQHKALAKNVTIRTEPLHSGVRVLINPDKLARVLTNVLTNAIKFSREGGLITVGLFLEENNMIIRISDNGIGIPVTEQPYIFDVSRGFNRAGTGGEQSFGLGLSISRQIMETNRGRIWFESEEGKGTRFFLSLPVV